MTVFSTKRWWAMVTKEFLQLRRDRITFGMIVGIPILQLLLFGYASNTEPKHLPSAVVVGEASDVAGALMQAERLAPDAIVTDIMFPEWRGAEVVVAVRELVPNAQLVVVMLREAVVVRYRAPERGFAGHTDAGPTGLILVPSGRVLRSGWWAAGLHRGVVKTSVGIWCVAEGGSTGPVL